MLFSLQADLNNLSQHVGYIKESVKSAGDTTLHSSAVEPVDLKALFPTMPCQTIEALNEVNEELTKNLDARKQMFLGLKQIGGSDPGEMIRSMLSRVVGNAVAVSYTYKGLGKDNKRFDSLEFVPMTLNIVRTHKEYKFYTEKAFKKVVTDWLRNSDRRLKTEEKLKEALDQQNKKPDYMDPNVQSEGRSA